MQPVSFGVVVEKWLILVVIVKSSPMNMGVVIIQQSVALNVWERLIVSFGVSGRRCGNNLYLKNLKKLFANLFNPLGN